jgi:hypothetical protein
VLHYPMRNLQTIHQVVLRGVYTSATMPLLSRNPVVEFRFILSKPIRLSLRTLHSLYRPQCLSGAGPSPRMIAQRRSLCLYKTAKAQTVLGQHKVIAFDPYELEPLDASEHLVNITKEIRKGAPQTIAESISLQEAYEKYIKPGQLIYSLGIVPKNITSDLDKLKAEAIATRNNDYAIFEGGSLPHNIKIKGKGKGEGALRVTPLSLSSSPEYFKLAIDRSYQFVEQGSPVEFTLRFKQGHVKKEIALVPNDHNAWQWIHRHFPHLRPDFILRSMPEGSRYVVDPVTNGTVLQFVIAKSLHKGPIIPENLTERLVRVKRSVLQHIENGQQAQLPKVYRQQLLAAGNEAYSPSSGMPLSLRETQTEEQEQEQEQEQGSDALGGFTMPAQPNRYMPMKPAEPQVKMRNDKLSKSGRLLGPTLTRKYDHKKVKAQMKSRVREDGDGRKTGLWEKKRRSKFIDRDPFKV